MSRIFSQTPPDRVLGSRDFLIRTAGNGHVCGSPQCEPHGAREVAVLCAEVEAKNAAYLCLIILFAAAARNVAQGTGLGGHRSAGCMETEPTVIAAEWPSIRWRVGSRLILASTNCLSCRSGCTRVRVSGESLKAPFL
jgi:hypothetical protein